MQAMQAMQQFACTKPHLHSSEVSIAALDVVGHNMYCLAVAAGLEAQGYFVQPITQEVSVAFEQPLPWEFELMIALNLLLWPKRLCSLGTFSLRLCSPPGGWLLILRVP